jgi:translation initiation factor 2B subunit (eIF-2B alpha/beta/delta family)
MAPSLAERVYELRADRRHGASWMARRAVEAVVAETREREDESGEALLARLVAAARELADARPEVGAVRSALGRLLAAAGAYAHLPPDELRRLVAEEGDALVAARERAARAIAIQLRPRLEGCSVLTHSASATVREALLQTPPAHVACTVSAPLEEGVSFSEELREAGLDVLLVPDEDGAAALEHASLLLVGADTVFRDGTICNKIGTRLLAEAAAARRVPVVVAAESLKLAPVDARDAPPLDDEAATLFDLTPGALVDELVTEEGSFPGDEVGPLVDRTPFLRDGWRLLAP